MRITVLDPILTNFDEIQYFGVSDKLPKKVTLPDESQDRGKTLKLSYSPFFNKDEVDTGFTTVTEFSAHRILYSKNIYKII